jgi:hypothetical protein
MITVLTLSFALFVAYMATLAIWFGIPASISDSFYLLNGRRRGLGYVFTLWCWITAIAVMAMVFDVSDGSWYAFLGLFAGGGLGFVGAAPLFKTYDRVVHYVSAATCALAAVSWMCASGFWYVPAVSLALCIAVGWLSGKRVFWIETACFASMYIVLFVELWKS